MKGSQRPGSGVLLLPTLAPTRATRISYRLYAIGLDVQMPLPVPIPVLSGMSCINSGGREAGRISPGAGAYGRIVYSGRPLEGSSNATRVAPHSWTQRPVYLSVKRASNHQPRTETICGRLREARHKRRGATHQKRSRRVVSRLAPRRAILSNCIPGDREANKPQSNAVRQACPRGHSRHRRGLER